MCTGPLLPTRHATIRSIPVSSRHVDQPNQPGRVCWVLCLSERMVLSHSIHHPDSAVSHRALLSCRYVLSGFHDDDGVWETYERSLHQFWSVDCYVCPRGWYCLIASTTPIALCPTGHYCPAGRSNFLMMMKSERLLTKAPSISSDLLCDIFMIILCDSRCFNRQHLVVFDHVHVTPINQFLGLTCRIL